MREYADRDPVSGVTAYTYEEFRMFGKNESGRGIGEKSLACG